VVAVARWVVVEWHAQGTQTGPLRGEPPSGRRFERRGCAVAEVEEGKIVRYRDYFDRAQVYEPLGLMHLLTGSIASMQLVQQAGVKSGIIGVRSP
jgi:hypothetical protein